MSEDFYSVLGVSRDADEDEINNAFRKKASKYHPDVSDDPDAEETFKRIKKAKEVLTDDEKRQMYDQMGHERFKEAEKRGATDSGGAGRRGRGRGGPFGGGGGMGDIFEQFFGGSRSNSGRQQGADLKTQLSITVEEAYKGATKQLSVTRPDHCPECNGEGHPPDASSRTCSACDGRGQRRTVRQTPLGRVQQTQTCGQCEGTGTVHSETCSTCRGDGQVRDDATLQVEVPAGIRGGQTLRMEREGAPGENGGPKGDLLIEVEIED